MRHGKAPRALPKSLALQIMDEIQKQELFSRVEEQKKTQHIHTPYTETTGRQPDFEVCYELDPDPELGTIKPMQGMRTDFLYKGDRPNIEGIHMIWPEILNSEGKIITDKQEKIPDKGNALMWILAHESRVGTHRKRLNVGTKGYWVVGSKKNRKSNGNKNTWAVLK